MSSIVTAATPGEPGHEVTNTKSEEPQNTLTEQFTEKEWQGLREFRVKLPQIFKAAFPDNLDARTTVVKLWGVDINPTAPVDPRVSVVLVKFLRARDLDVGKAQEMMISTLQWRQEFKVDEVVKEQFPEDIFGPVGRIFGKDKEGRPVTYNIYGGNTKVVFSDVKRFIRWRVALMEKSISFVDFETVDSMLQIHDYAGVGMSSRDANSKAAASEASKIFQDYYPEFLSKKFFINVASYMAWMYWIFKGFLPSATVAKLTMIGTGTSEIKAALGSVIEDKELPKQYGGAAEGF